MVAGLVQALLILAVMMARWGAENRYDGIVARASSQHGVPASLIKAIIAAESSFNPGAIRHEDYRGRTPPSDWPEGVEVDASRGLMQVLCWRFRWLGVERADCDTLFDPYTNIMAGTKLLALNAAQLGSWDAAISAYNGGIRPALGFGKPLPTGRYRNQDYVDKVRKYWHYFETGEWKDAGFGKIALLAGLTLGALGFFGASVAVNGAATPLAPALDSVIIFAAGGAWWKLHDLGKRVEKLEKRIDRCFPG